MDIESKSSNNDLSKESNENEDNQEEPQNNWNINYDEERKFWLKLIEKKFTYEPEICNLCKIGKFIKTENNSPNVYNPYYLRCNFNKCRKKVNLRYFSVFRLTPAIPASIMYRIIEKFIIERSNAKEIYGYIKEHYNSNISYENITRKIQIIRKLISEFLKIKYKETNIGGFDHNLEPHIFAIDESLFCHDSFGQIWVVGAVDTTLKNIRMDIIRNRTASNIETFINNHFKEDSHFTHDGALWYNFLSDNINYTHERHNHGAGDFGYGKHSTSHIEALLAELKKEFFTIYGLIPSKNFIYFLREIEFRVIIKKLNNSDKINTLFDCIKKVYLKCDFKLSSKSELERFDNYD